MLLSHTFFGLWSTILLVIFEQMGFSKPSWVVSAQFLQRLKESPA